MSEFLNITGMETNTCNILRDNLHDRYDSGFPILKELIQNANDANASVLKISKHNGIFNATHPLLQKKALIIYNDGEVNENDLKGIVTVARGGKTGRSGVIGKFGLGMKSIFHFCDMFFYYAFVNGKEEIKAVNPFVSFATGKDDYHQDWNDFPESDRDLIKKNIIEVIGNQKKGLILWIPLRDDSYKYRIVKDIYKIENLWAGTDQNDSEYLKKNVALSLAALEISTPCNQSFRSLELISIETQEHPLIIEFKKNTNLITSNGEDYCLANKSGIIEDHEGEKKLKTLIEKDKFSKISDIDENGEEKEISLFSTGQKVSIAVAKFINSNEKSITFNWCSYLPLNSKIADQTKKYENLDGEYHLLIHANFAIDSGRRNIVEYSDCIDKSKDINLENVSDDKTSQIMWNMILIRNFIFTNLLKVVCSYKLSNLFYENLIDYITSEKSDFGCFCFTNGFIYKKIIQKMEY